MKNGWGQGREEAFSCPTSSIHTCIHFRESAYRLSYLLQHARTNSVKLHTMYHMYHHMYTMCNTSVINLFTDYALVCMRQRHTVVYLCICCSVCTLTSQRSVKTKRWWNAVQAQCNSILHLLFLNFWIKTLFSISGMICSPWAPLCYIPDSPEDKSTQCRSPWNLDLSHRYSLFILELHNKQAILASWIVF